MKLIPVETPEDFLLAQQFVLPHEETSVTLASLVRKKSDKLIFIKADCSILGILNLDSTIYHCIPQPTLLNAEELAAELPFLLKKPVRCISGQADGSMLLTKVLGLIPESKLPSGSLNAPKQEYSYRMMKWNNQNVAPGAPDVGPSLENDEQIIRCTENDMDLLKPLQKDYMKEEIAVPGRQISDAEVSIMLRQILKNQICLALLPDGGSDPVAKANTNAIGYNCIQIGGVYTHPLYRRNGYAGALVHELCLRAARAHRTPVLFVKEKNTPAHTLYQKLGFTECGRYAIAYY